LPHLPRPPRHTAAALLFLGGATLCALAIAPAVARADQSNGANDNSGAGIRAGGFAPLPETPQSKIAQALRKGDKAGALKQADEYLVDHPRDAQVRFLRAVALQDLGRIGDAQAAFESLTQDFPELAEPYNNLAVISANQGKFSTAEHYLQLAVTAQPNYVTARENLGDLYVTMATTEYEQASRLDAGNAAVKRKLTLARELSGKLRGSR
jgi:Flp pilus assembly protein TadD